MSYKTRHIECPSTHVVEQSGTEIKIYGDHISVSDGYHIMDELYEHRNLLFVTLLNKLAEAAMDTVFPWKAKIHADGTMYDGWFIAGAYYPNTWTGPNEHTIKKETEISYHLPLEYWDMLDNINLREHAPVFSGYTPKDVLERIKKYYL